MGTGITVTFSQFHGFCFSQCGFFLWVYYLVGFFLHFQSFVSISIFQCVLVQLFIFVVLSSLSISFPFLYVVCLFSICFPFCLCVQSVSLYSVLPVLFCRPSSCVLFSVTLCVLFLLCQFPCLRLWSIEHMYLWPLFWNRLNLLSSSLTLRPVIMSYIGSLFLAPKHTRNATTTKYCMVIVQHARLTVHNVLLGCSQERYNLCL